MSTPTSSGPMTKPKNRKIQGAKKGGSPRLSGMTKIKAFKRIQRKRTKIKKKNKIKSVTQKTLFPNLPLTWVKWG